MSALDDPEAWRKDAHCLGVDPELFFPSRGDSRSIAAARRVCAGCPVSEPCLDYALANEIKFGLWGCKSEKERRRLRRARTGDAIRVARAKRTRSRQQGAAA